MFDRNTQRLRAETVGVIFDLEVINPLFLMYDVTPVILLGCHRFKLNTKTYAQGTVECSP